MDEAEKKPAFTGSYGTFLNIMNKRNVQLEPMVLQALNEHGGQMEMKMLITSISASTGDIVKTVDSMKNRHLINVQLTNNEEIVAVA